jgi:predicted secreted protein
MPIATGLAMYFVIWWISLFLVLPWRAEPDATPAEGHAPSAPRNPHLVKKLLVNTALAAVLWLLVYALVQSGWISFRDMVRDE